MKKIIQRIYYSIICYDPIIRDLSNEISEDFDYDKKEYIHVASPIKPNRKQKREFLTKIHKVN